MTEKEKMLSGANYNARDPELIEMYHQARQLMHEYNNLHSTDSVKRATILKELFGGIGSDVWIEAPFYCDYGKLIFIGDHTFVNVNCMFLDDNEIRIGKNCLIGPYVQIYTATHPLQANERIIRGNETAQTSYRTSSRPVRIGDSVWIGGNTVIMQGVVIGDNVTIGAGSVVTKDLPPDVLAYGNPCRVKKALSKNH